MKNLRKIPRNFQAKFCWLEKPSGNIESNEVIQNSLKDLKQNVESTPKSSEYSSQKTIDSALNSVKNDEKLPESFKNIKASEFLKRSAEDLQTLFIDDGTINFRGNFFAKREIGLVDLFPKISEKQQFVVLDGITYAYGARRRDGKIGYGNPKYRAITGGEKIEFFIGPPQTEEQNYKLLQSFVKNDKGEIISPDEKGYKYENLVQNFAGFSPNLENLSPEQEQSEKKVFTEQLKSREKWQTYTLSIESGNDNIPLSEKKRQAMNFFTENGYTKEQAAGIIGNLIAESNLNPFAVGDGGKAFGIAQWHPDRQAIFSRVFGKDIHNSTFEEQLAFVKWELENTETTANNHLKSTTTASDAAYVFDKHFERSDGSVRKKRMFEAEKINNQYENLA